MWKSLSISDIKKTSWAAGIRILGVINNKTLTFICVDLKEKENNAQVIETKLFEKIQIFLPSMGIFPTFIWINFLILYCYKQLTGGHCRR